MLIGGQRRILLTERKSEALRAFSRTGDFGISHWSSPGEVYVLYMRSLERLCTLRMQSAWLESRESGWYRGAASSLFGGWSFFM